LRDILVVVPAASLLASVRKLGGLGLFLMGILDSSFLFLPFGNDLLLISLVSSTRDSSIWTLYVLLSALGSVIGVLLVDLAMRKMGEEGLERFVKPDKIKRLKGKMEKRAGWALFLATLLPPPFPFTAVVLTASALQTSRKKILAAVFLGRLVRFTLEAVLALYFGRQVLKILDSEAVEYAVYGFIAIALIGSVFSIYKWVRPRSRRARESDSEPGGSGESDFAV
jgi:membrane protein YqaA with SNARE-associated domain